MIKDRDEVIHKLIDIQYDRNEMDFKRGTFRVRGDGLEIYPAYSDGEAYRVEFSATRWTGSRPSTRVTMDVKPKPSWVMWLFSGLPLCGAEGEDDGSHREYSGESWRSVSHF